jgi:predicted phosphatase
MLSQYVIPGQVTYHDDHAVHVDNLVVVYAAAAAAAAVAVQCFSPVLAFSMHRCCQYEVSG